ncbi:hypothetical protein [Tahibacter amnicola]|uniref:SGNH/GDSL hydrolase family protein n=1 Tax=Tahibacter amnicola TaxID=2976241 RepID=A0ABY6BDU0_9GAMM|nr:hypothetical protein [Tahibacter amnicola]UXI67756.1 hypothetical protein N4264_23985 [Tahibacter amnicola]
MKRCRAVLVQMLAAVLIVAGTLHAAPSRRDAARHILIVGNSLSYTNNLPGVYTALARASGRAPASVDMIATSGGTLADRWRDGVALRLLDEKPWDLLILQERGGRMACLSQKVTVSLDACRDSRLAHAAFARAANERNTRVLLLGAWGRQAQWQRQLGAGLQQVGRDIRAEVLDAGPVLLKFDQAYPSRGVFIDEQLHPSIEGTVLIATLLYRQIHGEWPAARGFEATLTLPPPEAYVSPWQTFLAQSAQLPPPETLRVSAQQMRDILSVAESATR